MSTTAQSQRNDHPGLGAVVDVEVPRRPTAPDLHRAEGQQPLHQPDPDNLTLEVAQHLGDNVVRTIAMDTTDGLTRGAGRQEHRPR
jgi:F-type H+-transporting ATPase subunit beta